MGKSRFRGDVEGLRALAVLAVLGFHFQWGPAFTGGFTGVDIFFVISGFLITGNLVRDNESGSFSFKSFYARRVRRLFPALFFTVAATLACGTLISTPAELEELAKTSVASIASVANIFFYLTSGYFDSDALQKPLLHTWSLSVEEQFYLFLPAFLYLVYKLRLARALPLIFVGIVIGGTALAQATLAHDPNAAFYLTHYRMAEFALGALCAIAPSAGRLPIATRELLSIAGIVLAGYAIARFDDATPFPGVMALLPAAGASLIIYSEGRLVSWVLNLPAARYIGKISYSLYLVHWPVASFGARFFGASPDIPTKGIYGLISLGLAVGLYHLVEQRFRTPAHSAVAPQRRASMRRFAIGLGAVGIAICALSASIIHGNGWDWRLADRARDIAAQIKPQRAARFAIYNRVCGSGTCMPSGTGEDVFIIGDSHAIDAFNALQVIRPEYHTVLLNAPGCPPLLREDYGLLARFPERERCIAANEARIYGDTLQGARLVVINVLFNWYRPEHLAKAIRKIQSITDAPIVVFGNYLVFEGELPPLVMEHGSMQMDAFYERHLSKSTFAYDNELAALAKQLGFTFISKRRLMCDGNKVTDCPIEFDGSLFSYDKHHLSIPAATAMGAAINENFSNVFPKSLGTRLADPEEGRRNPARVGSDGAGASHDGQQVLWLEPAFVCDGLRNGRVSINWNLSGYNPGLAARIYVRRPLQEPKLFAIAQRQGHKVTGPWMEAGHEVSMRDGTGKTLAAATLGGTACTGRLRPAGPTSPVDSAAMVRSPD